MKFNVNNYVTVKISDRGRELIKESKVWLYKEPDENGYIKLQMWDLMKEFGPYIYLGCIMPFDTTIELHVDS